MKKGILRFTGLTIVIVLLINILFFGITYFRDYKMISVEIDKSNGLIMENEGEVCINNQNNYSKSPITIYSLHNNNPSLYVIARKALPTCNPLAVMAWIKEKNELKSNCVSNKQMIVVPVVDDQHTGLLPDKEFPPYIYCILLDQLYALITQDSEIYQIPSYGIWYW